MTNAAYLRNSVEKPIIQNRLIEEFITEALANQLGRCCFTAADISGESYKSLLSHIPDIAERGWGSR